MENYVTLNLETYNELKEKATKYDEVVKSLNTEDVKEAVKNACNSIAEFMDEIMKDGDSDGK